MACVESFFVGLSCKPANSEGNLDKATLHMQQQCFKPNFTRLGVEMDII